MRQLRKYLTPANRALLKTAIMQTKRHQARPATRYVCGWSTRHPETITVAKAMTKPMPIMTHRKSIGLEA